MSINSEQIQALEASALAATTGDWTADDNFGFTVQCYRTGTNRLLATVNGPNAENDMRFISQASPQNILRVLAELEADKALIAKQAKRIAELREWNAGLAQESLDRQQRIAELEASTLTVKLPKRATADKYVDGTFDNSDLAAIYNTCRLECEVKIKNACAAAGITLDVGE